MDSSSERIETYFFFDSIRDPQNDSIRRLNKSLRIESDKFEAVLRGGNFAGGKRGGQ